MQLKQRNQSIKKYSLDSALVISNKEVLEKFGSGWSQHLRNHKDADGIRYEANTLKCSLLTEMYSLAKGMGLSNIVSLND